MLGLFAVVVAAASGAKTIIVYPLEHRRTAALQYGAEIAINPTDGDVQEQIVEVTHGHGCDVCVEASGNDNAIASLFDIAAHSARVHLIGHSIGRKVSVEIGKTIWKTLNITGSGGTKNFGQCTIRFMDRVKDTFDFGGLNAHYFDFLDLHKAIDVAVHDKANALKVMLMFGNM